MLTIRRHHDPANDRHGYVITVTTNLAHWEHVFRPSEGRTWDEVRHG